jgi:folate-binding protein YgfZ
MLTARDFEAIAAHLGFIDRSNRTRLDVTGPDRAKFLHNLTTNDVKRLATGRGCEAFVTSPQGKTLGYVIVLASDDGILVRTDPGGLELVLPHLRKYGVFDDVTIDDRTAHTFEFHVVGADAAALIERAFGRLPESVEYAHIVAELEGSSMRVIREAPAGLPGLTLIGGKSAAQSVKDALLARRKGAGFLELDSESFEVLRIEAGTPVFGKDVTDKNLPQEIGRDDRAINFVKGCYLGQETVARIDALGHVNQVLTGLRFEPGSPVPESGWLLEDNGKRVGSVTSAAFSPVRDAPIALGLVRTTHFAAGTRVSAMPTGGTEPTIATVSDLPF